MKKKSETDIDISINFSNAEIPSRWKAIQLEIVFNKGSITRYLRYLWGLDIWFNSVPLCKSIVLANVIVWIVLFIIK